MKLSTFGFLTRRGVRNLGKHWAMTIACIASLSVCMTLNTFATLAEVNVDSMVNYLGQQNEMVVFVDPEADDATTASVGERITATPGVTVPAELQLGRPVRCTPKYQPCARWRVLCAQAQCAIVGVSCGAAKNKACHMPPTRSAPWLGARYRLRTTGCQWCRTTQRPRCQTGAPWWCRRW